MRSHRLRIAALAAALAAPAATAQAATVIQPGAQIVTSSSQCTLNWIYDGEGGVHGGTAAHCVSGVGQEVQIVNDDGSQERIGQVSFKGDQNAEGRDYAFIAIDLADHGKVNAALKGHPGIPTGLSTQASAKVGDTVQFSGYGTGVALTATTRERRQGILSRLNGKSQDAIGIVTPGDSGGPVANVTDGNKAFGIVDTVGAGFQSAAFPFATVGEGGAMVAFALADAASLGFSVSLRTV